MSCRGGVSARLPPVVASVRRTVALEVVNAMTTELADNVRKYRRRSGMSQEELAHAAGVSQGTVRKVEQGDTVRMETLHILTRVNNPPGQYT